MKASNSGDAGFGRTNMKKLLLFIPGFTLIIIILISLSHCGVTVQPGESGVKIKTLMGAGVDPTPLPQGWHMLGIGERVVQFPNTERAYPFTRSTSEGRTENEEISFADVHGLPITGDVNITLRVLPGSTPALYTKWRLGFNDLLDTPIRNDVRSEIAQAAEHVAVEDMFGGGRELIIQKALQAVRAKWQPQGVEISSLAWIGNLRPPQSTTDAITNKSRVEQETFTEQANVAKQKAIADAKIESARGEAESTRLKAAALTSNPQVLRQEEIHRWTGQCPLDTKTCIIGAGALTQVQAGQN